ncbi:MAG: hypothetical protein WCO26_07935 [Deltaproteobacteria bacterium]
MISRILIIADASKDASVSVLDAFQMIRNSQPYVRALLISHLSERFRKNVGPNMLSHIMKEEKESLRRAKDYFTRMGIPRDSKVITVPPWETVFNEVKEGVQDLIILQGEFLETWREDERNYGLCSHTLYHSSCPLFVINPSGKTSLSCDCLDSEAPL